MTFASRWKAEGKSMPIHDWTRVDAGIFHEPVAEGDHLIDMPLFLDPGRHVSVPIEETYQLAFESVPPAMANGPRTGMSGLTPGFP